jgi:hypothetical protein
MVIFRESVPKVIENPKTNAISATSQGTFLVTVQVNYS